MSQAHVHHGPYSTIAPNSSPGLLFLKQYLSAVDNLHGPWDNLRQLIAPQGELRVNAGQSVTVDQVIGVMENRSKTASKFVHELEHAWEIEEPESASRTIMFESTSITVSIEDPDQKELTVKEFTVMEVKDHGDGQLKAREVKTFMDARPLEQELARLRGD